MVMLMHWLFLLFGRTCCGDGLCDAPSFVFPFAYLVRFVSRYTDRRMREVTQRERGGREREEEEGGGGVGAGKGFYGAGGRLSPRSSASLRLMGSDGEAPSKPTC